MSLSNLINFNLSVYCILNLYVLILVGEMLSNISPSGVRLRQYSPLQERMMRLNIIVVRKTMLRL